jgi:hypothetical protein
VGWWIVAPIRFDAFHPRAQAMAYGIADLVEIARVKPGPEVFPQGPDITVRFKTRSGREERIEIGAGHPDAELDFIYCRTGQDTFMTRGEFRKTFTVSLEEMRSRTLFPVPLSDAAGLAVAGDPRAAKAIERAGDGWRLRQPLDAAADRAETESLLGDLNAWTVVEFVKDDAVKGEDLAAFGLDRPRLSVTVRHVRERSVTLDIGSGKEEAGRRLAHARHAGTPFVFTVEEGDIVERLLRPAEEFRSPLVFDLGVETIEELAASTGDGKTSVRMNRLAVGGVNPPPEKAVVQRDHVWQVTDAIKGETFPGDQQLIAGLTGALASTLIQKFVDAGTPLATLGLDPPRAVVVLKTAGGRSLELRIGDPSAVPEDRGLEVYHAARPGEPGSYLVRTDWPALLAEGAAAFRKRDVSLLEPAEALAIEVLDGGKSWELMRLPEEPWTLAEDPDRPRRPGAELDQGKVNAFLAALDQGRFRAGRFLPELADPPARGLSLTEPRRGIILKHVHDEPAGLFKKLVLGDPVREGAGTQEPEEVLAKVDLPGTPPFTVAAEVARLLDDLVRHLREITGAPGRSE